jgi:transposase
MFKDLAREQEQATGRVNISALSRETGFDRKTVRYYLSRDRPPVTPRTRTKPSKLDPYKPYILERLANYPRLSRVRLLEEIQEQGYDGKATILGDYLRQVRPTVPVLPEIQYETKSGEMAQCDWSECIASRPDGSEKKVHCFTMVLGYSRVRYIEFTMSQDLQTFLECHLHAFEYFGGVPQVLLYDNLGSVVLKRKYPSTASDFHPAFVDLRDHFGFTARLCRVYRAKTKGKVERSIGFVKDNFLYGREFISLDELNLRARTPSTETSMGQPTRFPLTGYLRKISVCSPPIHRIMSRKSTRAKYPGTATSRCTGTFTPFPGGLPGVMSMSLSGAPPCWSQPMVRRSALIPCLSAKTSGPGRTNTSTVSSNRSSMNPARIQRRSRS